MADYKVIGKDIAPKDLRAKITGRAKYAEDFRVDGMLFAKLFLSPMPRARVRSIDARAALALEGVVAIITADDLPVVDLPREPILTNTPLYEGQPICAIAAETETIAAEAIALLKVDLEPLPFVLEPLDSLAPRGPVGVPGGNTFNDDGYTTLRWSTEEVESGRRGVFPRDAATPVDWSYGDLEDAFARAAIVVEEPIVHQSQTHHPLESRSSLAYWQNGKLYLHCSTQSVAQTKRGHAAYLEMEEEDLVIISEYCGGGFGSKIRGTVTDLIPAVLSRKAGRPVMMRVSRDEETYFGRARCGLQGWIRAGFRADGKVLAIDLMLLQDNGPFTRQGDFNMAGSVVSLGWQPDAMRFRAVPVLTNTHPKSAQRAPGGVQAEAMVQPVMDLAARRLGVDRLAMLRANVPGHSAVYGGGQAKITSSFALESVDLGAQIFNWAEKTQWSGREVDGKLTGVGVCMAPFVAGSSGFDGIVVIRPDGKLYVHQGIGNLGSHSVIDTARAAAEVLQVDWADVEVVWGNTANHLPWSSSQSGSQTTFAHTRANHAAAQRARQLLQEMAARDLGGSPDQYEVANRRVFRRGNPAVGLSFAQAAQRAIELGGAYDGHEVPEDLNVMSQHAVRGLAGQGLVAAAKDVYPHDGGVWSFVTAFAVVEVDRYTGRVELKELMATTDCGTVMHPRNLAAQVHGGFMQGASIALFERWSFDPQWGVNSNRRFYTAKPTTILDMPNTLAFGAVDLPDPQSPVGAKGIGEPPICAGAGALAAAIADAIGGEVLLHRTPLSPDRILMALEGRSPSHAPLTMHL